MRVSLILSLLLVYSCTKYAQFSKDAIGVALSPVTMEVSRLREIEWLVGRPKSTQVTQSITFMVDLPKIKAEDLEYLTQNYDVDAWILRLIVQRGSEVQDLGSLYSPFQSKKLFRGGHNTGAHSNVSIKIYYAAAYASEKFRNFSCPAFGHDVKIDAMEIHGQDQEFSLHITQSMPYPERSQLVELSPSAFNAGNSMKGEYFIEVAPYNSQKKVILASFKRLPQSIVISREEKKSIPSCAGTHSETE